MFQDQRKPNIIMRKNVTELSQKCKKNDTKTRNNPNCIIMTVFTPFRERYGSNGKIHKLS